MRIRLACWDALPRSCLGAALLQYRNKSANNALRRSRCSPCCLHSVRPACRSSSTMTGSCRSTGSRWRTSRQRRWHLRHARDNVRDNFILAPRATTITTRSGRGAAGADYLAFGAFHPSPTNPDARRADPHYCAMAGAMPAFGGHRRHHGRQCACAGSCRRRPIAVISSVFDAVDPVAAARAYARHFDLPDSHFPEDHLFDSTRSQALFARAKTLMPGGVNSPVRAFKRRWRTLLRGACRGRVSVRCRRNRYIDYVGSWGPMIVGHNHPAVSMPGSAPRATAELSARRTARVTMAENIVRLVPWLRDGGMVNSAPKRRCPRSALARGATDVHASQVRGLLPRPWRFVPVRPAPARDFRRADVARRAEALADLTLTLPFHDVNAATALFDEAGTDIAGLIIEPVVGNANCIPPRDGFLQHLR